MNKKLDSVLIVGGGFSGLSAGIQLRKAGIETHVVEKNPDWKAYGAGITIGAPTLRALDTLGLYEEFQKQGSMGQGLHLYTANGHHITTVPTPPPEESRVPCGGAIMRPVLGDIMAESYLNLGGTVAVGCVVETMQDNGDSVDVTFSDGTQGTYDLVIGSDGLFSQIRTTIFPDAPKPKYSGQGVWRAVLKRPADIDTSAMWTHPASKLKAGVNPISATHMYLYLTDPRPNNEFIPQDQQLKIFKKLLCTFTAPAVMAMSEELSEESQVLYRPLEGMLLPLPWHKGNTVLLGDAVHATTPHLAMGAGLGIEDGIVLVEELLASESVSEGLKKYEERRWERCRMVVENSRRLGEIEMEGGDMGEHAMLMKNSMQALVKTI